MLLLGRFLNSYFFSAFTLDTLHTLFSFVLKIDSSGWFYFDLKNRADLCVYLNITPKMTLVVLV